MLRKQIEPFKQLDRKILLRKLKRIWRIPHEFLLLIVAVPVVVMIRLISPWVLIRWDNMTSPRIGHFAANPELYLCEREAGIAVPKQRHIDIFFMEKPISNHQLAKMWRRVLRVWPHWLMSPVRRANLLLPGGKRHQICDDAHSDRDIHNLLDRCSPHLEFTADEEFKGLTELRKIGVPQGAQFVCLIVRDSAYLNSHQPKDWSYHNYRDTDIKNYVLVAEELADRGYYVLRMGAKVNDCLESNHPRVIDYATNGMRSDFMDIYLGAKCAFCISTSTGFDAIPLIFRRPIVFVNLVPVGYLWTFSSRVLAITRRHFSTAKQRDLSLEEIFTCGVGLSLKSSEYETSDIKLIENSPEEICSVVIEMEERLMGTWQADSVDDDLQRRFWSIFPIQKSDINGRPLHGKISCRIGADFLRTNVSFLK